MTDRSRKRELPKHEAFAYYVSLGQNRSHAAVAKAFGVGIDAVHKVSAKQRWSARLKALEEAAAEQIEAELVESMASMQRRHLQTLRVVHTRAVEALRDYPLRSAMEAVRALEVTIKLERAILGLDAEGDGGAVRELRQREEDTLVKCAADDEDAEIPSPAETEFEVIDDAESENDDGDEEGEAA